MAHIYAQGRHPFLHSIPDSILFCYMKHGIRQPICD